MHRKILKYISLVVIMILTIGLFIKKDKISVFAKTKNLTDVKIGDIFKVGDVLPFNDTVSPCSYDSNYSCNNYGTVELRYLDSRLLFIDSKSYDYSYPTSTNPNFSNIIVDNNYSKYWQLVEVSPYSSDSILIYKLVPYEYKEPEFSLSCNPVEVKPGESSVCSLNVTYYNNLENIDFGLSISDFDIYNININDSFKDVSDSDGVYSLSPLDELVESEEGTEISLITFEVKSEEEKGINLEDNIRVVNLGYSDNYSESDDGEVVEVTSTVKQVTPSDDMVGENPKTGDTLYLVLCGILTVVFSVGLFFIINKNQEIQL